MGGTPGSGVDRAPSMGGRVAVALGFVLHAAMGFVILVSGLIMPVWAVALLGAVWLLALAVQLRGRRRPFLVLAVPFAMLAVWAAAAWLGDAYLDWTA